VVEIKKKINQFQPQVVPVPKGDYSFLNDIQWPAILEIGSGTGDFAIKLSKNCPNTILAVEKTSEKFRKFKEKISNLNLNNLIPIHANAINFVSHFVPPQSLKTCYINYPNPYPKESQANKRFHRMPFFGFLLSRMGRNGEVFYASNEKFLVDEAILYLTEYWKLNLVDKIEIKKGHFPISAFEKKYLDREEPCWHLKFRL
jgi:tRNA G46 methylase TrmB